MPILWQLKTHRDERANTHQRLNIRFQFADWLTQQKIPLNYYIFGQDIINNQVWVVFKEEKYESVFALSFLGSNNYRLVTFDQPYQFWPAFSKSQVTITPTSN
jgi:hypothetical protein